MSLVGVQGISNAPAGAGLEESQRKLRKQLEQFYIDKVAGEVPASIYPNLRQRLEKELAEAELQAAALKRTEPRYYDAGLRILELAQTASVRFKAADPDTRRAILLELQSNCVLRDGEVEVSLNEPFDILLSTNLESREKGLDSGPFEIWYTERDSNRCGSTQMLVCLDHDIGALQ